MSILCQYKDALGKPNEGVHSYRIFNMAAVDLAMSAAAAGVIAYNYGHNIYTSFIIILFIILITSTIVHKSFCVETPLTKLIFD